MVLEQVLSVLAGISTFLKRVFTKFEKGHERIVTETSLVNTPSISDPSPDRGSVSNECIAPSYPEPNVQTSRIQAESKPLTQKYRNFMGFYDPQTRNVTITKWVNRRSRGKEMREVHSEYVLFPVTQEELKNYVSIAATGKPSR